MLNANHLELAFVVKGLVVYLLLASSVVVFVSFIPTPNGHQLVRFDAKSAAALSKCRISFNIFFTTEECIYSVI